MAQINERAELERNAKDEDYANDQKLVETLAVEENQFQQYANKVGVLAFNWVLIDL